ncbi:MAG: ribosome biogenesis GTP-binding protein YihA/YsxC [Rickettsiales bacterium]|jgi:GTP-binding protein|nr:ribosome biogenesis GTP-binding protein YihA/YsxC [Rickettsiales bacterium]
MNIKFLGSFEKVQSLPKTHFDEYAFVGRSNVGKSSLINAIAGAVIARTSKTPGRTQSLNLFNFGDRLAIMDLPGYGYAKISKETEDMWLDRLQDYLINRDQLKLLFLLIDARHELKKSDKLVMDFCDANAIRYQIILTKIDKSNKKIIAEIKNEIGAKPRPAATTDILETSANKNIGIEYIKKVLGLRS